jgi:hypothetical protein
VPIEEEEDIFISAGTHQPGLSYTYTQRPYLYVFWFNKELTKEIIMLRSQGLAAANNMVHCFSIHVAKSAV